MEGCPSVRVASVDVIFTFEVKRGSPLASFPVEVLSESRKTLFQYRTA